MILVQTSCLAGVRGQALGVVRQTAIAAATFAAIAGAVLLSGSSAFAQCSRDTGSNSARGSGWVAGAQAGYNWQQGSWVYGLETDLSGTGLESSMDGGISGPSPCIGDFANTSASVPWYGTLRGRAGWTADKALFYGTGGLSYGKIDLSSNYSALGFTVNSQTSSVRAGWVIGAGIDYMLQPNVILNLGYQYVDLGTVSLVGTAGPLTQTARAHAAFHVLTVGLSWRFAPTDSAMKPWQGMYAGGHAGGAWGLNTDADYTSPVLISDVRLKRDIALVGRLDDGLGLYRYRYLWSDTVFVGVMAQEVALLHPEAIVRNPSDDYLRVDYGRLGLRLMILPEWDARSQDKGL